MTDSPDSPTPPPPTPEPPAALTQTPEPVPAAVKPSADNPNGAVEHFTGRVDGAWEARHAPGRFETGAATNITYSAAATSTESAHAYADWLGKPHGAPIHSGELAERHAQENPDTGTIAHTPGGRELDALEKDIKSSDLSPGEKATQLAAMKPLWESGSAEFAKDAAAKPYEVSFTENTGPDKVFSYIEQPITDANDAHVRISNAPLNPDGTPPPQDKIPPHMLDSQGRVHQA